MLLLESNERRQMHHWQVPQSFEATRKNRNTRRAYKACAIPSCTIQTHPFSAMASYWCFRGLALLWRKQAPRTCWCSSCFTLKSFVWYQARESRLNNFKLSMAQAIALKGVEFQSSHTISFSSVRCVILYSFQFLTKQCLLTPPLYVAFTWLWVLWIPIALASSCYGYCPASSLIFFIIYNLPLGSNPILNQAYMLR